MIEIIGAIIFVVGLLTMVMSFNSDDDKLSEKLFMVGMILMVIGLIIIIIFFVITGQCLNECGDRNLIFSHQEYNQCGEELTCYCTQPIATPKTKVVIIK